MQHMPDLYLSFLHSNLVVNEQTVRLYRHYMNRKNGFLYLGLSKINQWILVEVILADFMYTKSKSGKSMNICIIVVYVMENIFSYGPNLKIEIGGNGSHFKNGGRLISKLKNFKQS